MAWTVAIKTFGCFSVTAGGEDRTEAVSLRMRRCFAHLVLRAEAADRRVLAAELWPDAPDERALANLRRRLHELERGLAAAGMPDAIERTRSLVALSPAARRCVDLTRYVALARDSATAAQAAELYAEPIFPGVDDEWLERQRLRLRNTHLDLLATLLDSAIRRFDASEIAAAAEAIVALDPSSEQSARRAVTAMDALGETDRARRLFERFAQAMRSEIGVDPSPVQLAGPPAELPFELSPFFGRERELEEVVSAFDRSRLVTLVGPLGVGKSRIALRAAARVSKRFAGGLRYLDVSQYSASGAAAALADGFEQSAGSLLLLDNAEHSVREIAPVIDGALRKLGSAAVLATSRVPLHLDGESVLRVEPLQLASDTLSDTATFEQSSAVAFFLDRAQLAGARLERTQERLAVVAVICRELDGLPLALELAARRLPPLGLVNLRRRLADRFALLNVPGRDTGGRRDALMREYEWSYELLSDEEQRLFRSLGLFQAPWTLERIGALLERDPGEFAEAVARLCDASLACATADGESFSTLRSTREFMRQKLAETGELEELSVRYVKLVLQPLIEHNDQLRGATAGRHFDEVERQMGDIRCALDAAIVRDRDLEAGARALAALSRFFFDRGHAREARRWYDEAIRRLPNGSALRGEMLYLRALLERNLGRMEQNLPSFLEAIAELRSGGDPTTLAKAMLYASNAAHRTGGAQFSRELATQAHAIMKEGGDPYMVAFALTALGAAAYALGDLDTAQREFESARDGFAALGASDDEALMVVNAAACMYGRGDVAAAEEAFTSALDRAGASGNRYVEAYARIGLTLAALDRDEVGSAQSHAQRAAEICRNVSDIELSVIALEAGAELFLAQNELARARDALAGADGVRAQYLVVRTPTEHARCERVREALAKRSMKAQAATAAPDIIMSTMLGSLAGSQHHSIGIPGT